jgi:hypothetical protein
VDDGPGQAEKSARKSKVLLTLSARRPLMDAEPPLQTGGAHGLHRFAKDLQALETHK